jgi:hypothetical protein
MRERATRARSIRQIRKNIFGQMIFLTLPAPGNRLAFVRITKRIQ